MWNDERCLFVVKVTGEGEGCDYTIGCNTCTSVLPERITTMEEAVEYVTRVMLPRYSLDDIKAAVIRQVTRTEKLDMQVLRESYHEKRKRKAEGAARKRKNRNIND